MGLLRVYSIYDEKAEEFSPPFFQPNHRLAQRMVTETAKGNGNMLNAYPEDFKLYFLGTFDNSTGKIEREDMPVLVMAVKEMLKGEKRNVEN